MIFSRLLIYVCLLMGCSSASNSEPNIDVTYHNNESTYIAPALRPYVRSYIEIMNEAGIPDSCQETVTTIQFGVIEDDEDNGELTTIGVCSIHYLVGMPIWGEVTISRTAWSELSNDVRRWLMFHELTHCYYNMDHVDREDAIMYYTIHGTDASMHNRWDTELGRLVHDIRIKCGSSNSLNMSNSYSGESKWPGLDY